MSDEIQITPLRLPPAEPVGDPPKGNIFYVILNGLVPIVEYGPVGNRKLRAYMLFVKGHDHLAGQWLAEQEVPLGFRGEVRGLKPGHYSLNDQDDGPNTPLVKVTDLPSVRNDEVWAYFELPLPRRPPYYLNRGAIQIDDHDGQLRANAKYLSGTRVLEYELATDFRDVYIESKAFDAESKPVSISWWINGERRTNFPAGSISTLHLIDSPRKPVQQSHNLHEFDLNGRVLVGRKCSLKFSNLGTTAIEDEEPVPGLSRWETLSLGWRTDILQALTGYLRTGEVDYDDLVNGSCEFCCAPANGIG